MSEAFAREIVKQAVARACSALEYTDAQMSALDALTDVVRQYVLSVAEQSRDMAENAGRSIPGIQDVISVLETMRLAPATWKELKDFALVDPVTSGEGDDTHSSVWCQPFPVAVPAFPAKRRRREVPQPVGESVPRHFPQHLPAFPPAHTYKKSEPIKKSKASSSKSSTTASSLAISKSVQDSLAVLEGCSTLNRKRKRDKDSSDSIPAEILKAGVSAIDESEAGGSHSAKVFVNPSSEKVKALTREQRILLGVLQPEAGPAAGGHA